MTYVLAEYDISFPKYVLFTAEHVSDFRLLLLRLI